MTIRQNLDNKIFIGEKPFINYVTAVAVQFNNKNMKEVIISARGKWISKAVDVCEVVRRTFLKDKNILVKEIIIGSQDFKNSEGKDITVSTMDVTLIKGDEK